jgi:hypothetical protein
MHQPVPSIVTGQLGRRAGDNAAVGGRLGQQHWHAAGHQIAQVVIAGQRRGAVGPRPLGDVVSRLHHPVLEEARAVGLQDQTQHGTNVQQVKGQNQHTNQNVDQGKATLATKTVHADDHCIFAFRYSLKRHQTDG